MSLRLGLGKLQEADCLRPKVLPCDFSGALVSTIGLPASRVVFVAAGMFNSAALCENNLLYVWGSADALGIDRDVAAFEPMVELILLRIRFSPLKSCC